MGYPETMRDILELERKEELKNKKETLENRPIACDIEDSTTRTGVIQRNYFENADESIKSTNDILSQSQQESKRK